MTSICVLGSNIFSVYITQILQLQLFPDVSLTYLGDTRTSSIPTLADQIKHGGYSVAVLGPSDHARISPYISIPCYIVRPTIADFLQIHTQIEDYRKTAVLLPDSLNLKLSILEESLRIKYRKQTYTKVSDLPQMLRKLKDKGITTVIGGQSVVDQARQLGMDAHYYYRRINLEAAIQNAIQISRNMEQDQAHIREVQSILDNTMCGALILSGPEGKISYANQTALNMLHCDTNALLQKPISELIQTGVAARILSGSDSEHDLQFNLCGADVIGNIIVLPTRKNEKRRCLLFENASHILKYETMIRQEFKRKNFQTRYTFEHIVGQSQAIQKAIAEAKRFARSDSTVLISAETGSGKEIFAQSIHNASPRSRYPFVAINCASIPDTLIESELFGYAPGAFTGASSKGKAGLVELANHGTVFLDDIDSLSTGFQAKLLRVMQEREIIRVGGNSTIPVDVRFVVATNRNLKELVANGAFRNDLYFRINVLHLRLPSLRSRPEDIPALYEHYLSGFDAELYQRIAPGFSDLFAPALTYSYPGNVRELISIAERFVALAKPELLDDDAYLRSLVQDCLETDDDANRPSYPSITGNYAADVADAERCVLNAYLEQHNGSMTQLARQLGISRTTLYNKLRTTEHSPDHCRRDVARVPSRETKEKNCK